MKEVPAKNKGLSKLPKEVRNKMGYKAKGGKATKGRSKMMAGGKTTKGRSKMMAGGKTTKGRSKMMGGGKSTKGYARGGKTKK